MAVFNWYQEVQKVSFYEGMGGMSAQATKKDIKTKKSRQRQGRSFRCQAQEKESTMIRVEILLLIATVRLPKLHRRILLLVLIGMVSAEDIRK